LMKNFGSIEKIKNSTVEELANVEGMNIKAAKDLYHHFHKEEVK